MLNRVSRRVNAINPAALVKTSTLANKRTLKHVFKTLIKHQKIYENIKHRTQSVSLSDSPASPTQC